MVMESAKSLKKWSDRTRSIGCSLVWYLGVFIGFFSKSSKLNLDHAASRASNACSWHQIIISPTALHACVWTGLRDESIHLKNLKLNNTTSIHIVTFYPNVMHLNHITICFIINIRQLVNGKMCIILCSLQKTELVHPLRVWEKESSSTTVLEDPVENTLHGAAHACSHGFSEVCGLRKKKVVSVQTG